MPIEREPPHFDPDAPIRAPDLNLLGQMIADAVRYFGDRLPEIIPNDPGITQPPIECFPAVIKTAAALASPGVSEPTDARYYLQTCIAKLGIAATDAFDVQADTFPGVPSYVVATNLAELSPFGFNSHLLPTTGTCRVIVFAMPYRESPLKKQYVFWMVVPLPGDVFRVSLSSTGGSAGTSTTTAGFVYTATDLNGKQLGTSLSPERPRDNGLRTAATKGTGYYGSSGTFVLAEAWETDGTTACS